jgi:uncharacterized protein
MNEETPGKPGYVQNKFIRILLLGCGFLFTFLAILGALLPILPTTPFLIVAAACFYRSSEKFYRMIMYNRYFGHYLRDYKSGMGIPLRVKIAALLFLWISTLVSVFIFIPYLWLKILVITIAAGVTVHLYMIRTKKTG